MDQNCFWLSDAQFSRLEPLLPRDTRGKPRVDDRRVISGIIHVLISGCRWKDAPAVYGPRKTLYNRFQRTTKIHALTDTACRPVAFLLTGGQVADCTAAERLLDQLTTADLVHGDKGYDTSAYRRISAIDE